MHNGGYREDLTAVFNHDVNPGLGKTIDCMTQSEDESKIFIEKSLGLDYETVAYMATIVSMDSAAFSTRTYDELSVSAAATASLELNGGRVGEPATSYEKRGKSIMLNPGTINIMVFVNANMTPGCLAQAMVVAVEAKTAVLQELLAGSMRSSRIATGSGTDNMMIIANAESDNLLTYAGQHGKLGELIGVTVMDAVRQSLDQHMGLSEKSQHDMFARIKRFGITEKSFIEGFRAIDNEMPVAKFMNNLHAVSANGELVTLTSLYIHLLDQMGWGMITSEEAFTAGELLLNGVAAKFSTEQSTRDAIIQTCTRCEADMLSRFVSEISAVALSIK